MDHYSEAMRGHSRRELYLDRLAREFPQRSRQHLVSSWDMVAGVAVVVAVVVAAAADDD